MIANKFIALILIFAALPGSLPVFGQTQERGVGIKNAQRRLALIIGNSNYKAREDFLPNPVNDAKAMEQTLKSLGFEVILGLNTDKARLRNLIREFGDKLARNKGVGLFFYAGHGVAVNGTNYLIPIDADIPSEDEVDDAAIPIKFLLDKMELAGNPLNMLFLDACRNNPFARRWRMTRDKSASGGLTKIDTQGTMIFYATEYGKTAADGKDANSPFTKSLIKNLVLPNVEFERMFRFVINDVFAETKGQQKPWKEGAYAGEDFFFTTTTAVPDKKSGRILFTFGVITGRKVSSDEVFNVSSEIRGMLMTELKEKGLTVLNNNAGDLSSSESEQYLKGINSRRDESGLRSLPFALIFSVTINLMEDLPQDKDMFFSNVNGYIEVIDTENNKTILTKTFENLRGSGNSQNQARKNALNAIKKEVADSFLETVKEKAHKL